MIYTIAQAAMFLGMCRGMDNPNFGGCHPEAGGYNPNFGGCDAGAGGYNSNFGGGCGYSAPAQPYWDEERYGTHPNHPQYEQAFMYTNVLEDEYFFNQSDETRRLIYEDYYNKRGRREALEQFKKEWQAYQYGSGHQQAESQQAQGPNAYTGSGHQQSTKNSPAERRQSAPKKSPEETTDTSSNIRATLARLDAKERQMKDKKVEAEQSPIEQKKEADLKKRQQDRLDEYQANLAGEKAKAAGERDLSDQFRDGVKANYQREGTWWKDITIERQLFTAEELVLELDSMLRWWKNHAQIFWDEYSENEYIKHQKFWTDSPKDGRSLKKYLGKVMKLVSQDRANKAEAQGYTAQDLMKFRANHQGVQEIFITLRKVYQNLVEQSEITRRRQYLLQNCMLCKDPYTSNITYKSRMQDGYGFFESDDHPALGFKE